MADVQTLIDGNLEFARNFTQRDLALLPRLSTLVLTCLDARVDPAHFLGLELGDAVVMRNIGGRVTDEVIEHIAIVRALVAVAGAELLLRWPSSITPIVGPAASPTLRLDRG